MHELMRQIENALNPSGDAAAQQERLAAERYLAANGADAYPHLIALIDEAQPNWAMARPVELLGLLRQVQSIPLLQRLMLKGIPETSRAAGRSLGVMADLEGAVAALSSGLEAPLAEAQIAAVEGARLSGQDNFCDALRALLQESDANLRYYALEAAATLGCVDTADLARLAADDADPDVRALAGQWLARLRGAGGGES